MRTFRSLVLKCLVFLLLTWLLMEAASFFALHYSVIPYDLPGFRLSDIRSRFWVDMDSHFGAWHAPNSTYHHRRPCFQVDYQANAFGMRDRPRELVAKTERTLMLGDSYVEGYGLLRSQRLSDLLEEATGREYLNFGTSGHFGLTQYYLVYKYFAKQFSHDEVWLFIYPRNDFADDDYDVWKDSGRRRPFFVKFEDDYRLIYSKGPLGTERSLLLRDISGFLREFSYFYNVLSYAHDLVKFRLRKFFVFNRSDDFSGFYDFSPAEWDRMQFILESFFREAKGKKIQLVLIPSLGDLQRYAKDGPPPLSKHMARLANRYGLKVVDLLPLMYKHQNDWRQYYFSCDGHWNTYGNRVAAEYLSCGDYGLCVK